MSASVSTTTAGQYYSSWYVEFHNRGTIWADQSSGYLVCLHSEPTAHHSQIISLIYRNSLNENGCS